MVKYVCSHRLSKYDLREEDLFIVLRDVFFKQWWLCIVVKLEFMSCSVIVSWFV